MPIKHPFRAIALGLLLAAGASTTLMAQNPTSSRRPKILERLPALVQETEAPAQSSVTVQESSQVVQTAGVAPAKTSASKNSASKSSSTRSAAPKGMTPVSKTTAKSQAPAVPEPAAVPSMPGEGTVLSSTAVAVPGAAAGKPGYKTTPTDVGDRGPYLKQRVQYRRDQFKYRWDHYYKPGFQETHWGYPEEFCEKPLGFYVHANMKTQVANGEAAKMVLHEFDFVQGEARLNPRGREQLAKLAYMLPRNYFPLIIAQQGDDMTLADARRTAILGLLNESGFPVPEQRVVLATPLARGFTGPEAEFIGNGYFQSFQSGGVNYGFYTAFDDLGVGTYGQSTQGGTTNASVGGSAPGTAAGAAGR